MGIGNNGNGSGNGQGRLSSLKNAGTKSGLKFKPKVAARRSKAEREAAAPNLKSDEDSKLRNDRKRVNNKRITNAGTQNRRMARYLNNTHVVSTGPLAAGNFVSDKGEGPKRAFMKLGNTGGGVSPLVLQELQKMRDDNEDDEDDVNGEEDNDDLKKERSRNRINMGKEYSLQDLNDSVEEEAEGSPDIGEEAWRALKTEELFPVRPVRYKHQDLEILQNVDKDSSSDNTTREPTPGSKVTVKQEPTDNAANEMQFQLHKKLDELSLAREFRSLDRSESVAEVNSMNEDHENIWKTLNKINNKANRFVLFQLPAKLPDFEQCVIGPEADEIGDGHGHNTVQKKDEEPEVAHTPGPLQGCIGSIRVHKSGRLSAKIGNVVMDISRGTEATFLQDVVALNHNNDELPFAELLGRVDGRIIITPDFK